MNSERKVFLALVSFLKKSSFILQRPSLCCCIRVEDLVLSFFGRPLNEMTGRTVPRLFCMPSDPVTLIFTYSIWSITLGRLRVGLVVLLCPLVVMAWLCPTAMLVLCGIRNQPCGTDKSASDIQHTLVSLQAGVFDWLSWICTSYGGHAYPVAHMVALAGFSASNLT